MSNAPRRNILLEQLESAMAKAELLEKIIVGINYVDVETVDEPAGPQLPHILTIDGYIKLTDAEAALVAGILANA